MYHTIEIKDFTKPVQLENNTFDNRSGNLYAGYYNVRKKAKILKRRISEGVDPIDNFHFIEPGLYNIRQIIDIIALNNAPWLEMSIDEKSGEFSLHIKHKKYKLQFSSELAKLLGLPSDLLSLGMHNGHFDLQPFKIIYIHCDQISTSENIYNGNPCSILNVLPVRDKTFGESTWIEYSNPLRKNLTTSTFNKLSFKMKDLSGKYIDNHNLLVIFNF